MLLNNAFSEEVEVLQSIYLDDIQIKESSAQCVELSITVHPSTADDDNKKYVCLTLQLIVTAEYPNESPQVLIKNPRGLSDAHIASIEENLHSLATSRHGECMVFELIEYAKESLTDNNSPSCVCSICLNNFQDENEYFRTECYHYFHMYCVQMYFKSAEKSICPVCRLDIECTIDLSTSYTPPLVQYETFTPSTEYKAWLQQSRDLFNKQKQQGGIIDVEEEKNRFLITTNDIVSVSTGAVSTTSERSREPSVNSVTTFFRNDNTTFDTSSAYSDNVPALNASTDRKVKKDNYSRKYKKADHSTFSTKDNSKADFKFNDNQYRVRKTRDNVNGRGSFPHRGGSNRGGARRGVSTTPSSITYRSRSKYEQKPFKKVKNDNIEVTPKSNSGMPSLTNRINSLQVKESNLKVNPPNE